MSYEVAHHANIRHNIHTTCASLSFKVFQLGSYVQMYLRYAVLCRHYTVQCMSIMLLDKMIPRGGT